MGGCFGPRRNKMLVYADLLQQIYAESSKQELHQVRGSAAYDFIKDKLTKKGLLKKLVQHLSSHRNYLNDCAQTNWRMMNDSNTFNSKVTGLVVSNSLIHNLESFEAAILQPREASHGVLTPKIERRGNTREEVLAMGSEVDFRFENTIFRQALDLYDNEQSLRERVLQGLSEFALTKQGKFTCDRLVIALLNRLHKDIRQRTELFTQNCKAFGDVLAKSNDNIDSVEANAEFLSLFLSIWVEEENEVVCFYCENVIQTYMERNMTARDFGFIYSVLFFVYDHYGFDQPVFSSLEQKLLEIIGEDALKLQFQKGMFRYLLTYLSVTASREVMETRWEHGAFEVHYETLRIRYRHIQQRQSKLSGLKTLYRWLNSGQLNLNELILFNRDTLASCFVFNIYSYFLDSVLRNSFIKTFYSICNRSSEVCVGRLFEYLLEEVTRIDERTVEPGSILVRICCDLLQKYRLMYCMEQAMLLKPINVEQPHRTRLEVLYVIGVMLKECTTPLSQAMVESTNRMLYSLYANFTTKETLLQKLMTLSSMYPLFATLQAKGEIEMLIVFNRRLQSLPSRNFIEGYLQRYFSAELNSLLEMRDCVPRQMRQLNRLIAISAPNAEQEVLKFMSSSSGLWTSRASGYNTAKHYSTNAKKLENLQRQFDKEGATQECRTPVEIHIQNYNKTSVVSQTIRGEESVEEVCEMIRAGGVRRYEAPSSRTLRSKEKIRTSRNI